ncbi:DUF2927 domain-containing protein [Rhodobacteraceae bacterium W635]|uniref:DUF2927 domain-containing protein n=1 Tax=Nioella halotolerans TaxID=2303578 RepID=UPI000E3E7CF9|nr:DUF2927 domain-containing protein [Rhodobacteraceae bacterium W635]
MLRRLAMLAMLGLLAACAEEVADPVASRGETAMPRDLPEIAMFGTPNPVPPRRGNAAMARDFLDLAFQLESGRRVPVLTRFEEPITVAVAPGAPATLSRDLDRLLARLRREARIDIQRAGAGQPGAITIETLPRARMQRAVPQAACFVVPRVSSWAEFRVARTDNRTLDWTTLTSRERAAVFIPDDVSPQEVRDCLHEEVAQAIGPLNDLYRLPDSVFNDDNFHAVLTGFDMLILRAYYDDALASGMDRDEVARRLPAILNRLNPRGAGQGGGFVAPIDRDWIAAIEEALGGRGSTPARIAAAERAVRIANARGWRDTRAGFSYFALGRLTLPRDAERSIAAFVTAGNVFHAIAPGGIQSAHANMQLAAFALSAGDAGRALTLVNAALPAATRSENATLLATLLMIKAEALALQGRMSEAAAVRLDSLGWARYGFGRASEVRDRLTEVAALSPRNRNE